MKSPINCLLNFSVCFPHEKCRVFQLQAPWVINLVYCVIVSMGTHHQFYRTQKWLLMGSHEKKVQNPKIVSLKILIPTAWLRHFGLGWDCDNNNKGWNSQGGLSIIIWYFEREFCVNWIYCFQIYLDHITWWCKHMRFIFEWKTYFTNELSEWVKFLFSWEDKLHNIMFKQTCNFLFITKTWVFRN